MRKLYPEEIEYIKEIEDEITEKLYDFNYDLFVGKKVNYTKRFVNNDCSDFLRRQRAEAFTFFSKHEANHALYKCFSDPYIIKHIAKQCCLLEGGTRFVEEYDCELPLGVVMHPDKTLHVSSVVEAVIKVREPCDKNDFTGMPFDIIEFRLIPDDVPERSVYAGSLLDGSYKNFDPESLMVS